MGEPREGDLLPEAIRRSASRSLPVRRLPHGRRRPGLAPDVHEVPPQEVFEGAEGVGRGRLRGGPRRAFGPPVTP